MHYRKPFEFSAYHTQSMCKEAIYLYVAKPRYQTTETINSNINPTLVSTQFQTYVWLHQALEFDLWLAADVLVHDEVMCLYFCSDAAIKTRDIFRVLTNIYDATFLQK